MPAAAVPERPGRLAERDHEDEDEPRDEHAEDDVAPLFGGVGEQPSGHGRELTNRRE